MELYNINTDEIPGKSPGIFVAMGNYFIFSGKMIESCRNLLYHGMM
jgi:hypothetical protein